MAVALANDYGITSSTNGLDCKASSVQGVRADFGVSSGKYYWEVTKTVQSGLPHIEVITDLITGGSTDNLVNYSSPAIPSRNNTMSYYYNGVIYLNGSIVISGMATIVLGTVIGFALDLDNKTLGLYNNGTFQYQLDISSMSGSYYYPTVAAGNSTLCDYRFNFGSTSFYMTIPEGYTAFNTVDTGVYKSSLSAMTALGDKIQCDYTAASDTVGQFYNLGNAIEPVLPVAGKIAPKGKFNFIKVNKGLLVADRNIQHSVSWSTINAAKLIEGNIESLNRYKISNPSTLPAGISYGVAFSGTGTYMAVAHATSPYVSIYKRSGDVFTKLDNPTNLPAGVGYGVAFSSDDTYLAVSHATSPYITIYKRSGDVFTKLSNPGALPTGIGYGVKFSNDNTYLSVSHATTPFVTIYKRSGDVFTKLSNPGTLPPSTGYSIDFSYDDIYMAVGVNANISIYKRSGDIFTKLDNPATLPAGICYGVSFSRDNNYLATAHASAPCITLYKRTDDTFTSISITAPGSAGYGIAFAKNSNYLGIAINATPFVNIHKYIGDTFTKQDNPYILPPGTGRGVAFSNDDTYMIVVSDTSPYIAIYKNTNLNLRIRSLSSGELYATSTGEPASTNQSSGMYPINNEWDKYIVNANLGNTITPGDNTVWNWNGLYSWVRDTQSTAIAINTSRVVRGSGVANGVSTLISTTVNTTTGFRPVLEYNEDNSLLW